ncbi:uncharacterized protein VP01_2715g1 [Puccinia sorghi]|uniref:Mediator of RNA polymerase II transcription subunit 21 n=1 Tax=Puccinia sorghi TaxID=27349 RepID=A0A0L6V3F5_9BASI|nr:uncharacterized protein VP01_2715g1 [Puccinia sorghi]
MDKQMVRVWWMVRVVGSYLQLRRSIALYLVCLLSRPALIPHRVLRDHRRTSSQARATAILLNNQQQQTTTKAKKGKPKSTVHKVRTSRAEGHLLPFRLGGNRMTSHDAELSRNMDRITQLQDGIDNLVTIMYSTLSFLSRKADFKQVNPDIPITQAIPCPEGTQPPRETFDQNCEELVQDFLRKAKQIEYLISILPPHNQQPSKPTHIQPPKTTNPSSVPSPNPQQPSQIPSSLPSPQPDIKPTELVETDHQQLNPSNANQTSESVETKVSDGDEDDSDEFELLQADVNAAQQEHDQALLVAESLLSEIKTALRQISDHRVKLLSSSSLSSSSCNYPNG